MLRINTEDLGRATKRPSFTDLVEIPTDGYDVVELKYDGIWGRLEMGPDGWQVWSRHGKLKAQGEGTYPHAILHGEFMYGSQWSKQDDRSGKFFVFDIEELGDDNPPVATFSRDCRMDVLGYFLPTLNGHLGSMLELAGQWDLEDAPELWERFVEGAGYEGLVFKRSIDTFGAQKCARLKKRPTMDYVCMGFSEGGGKYKGVAVGSVRAGLYVDGELTEICNIGGLNEEQRFKFWKHPDQYVGRVFEAEGREIFSSGSLRHPNFLRWHLEKRARECVKPSSTKSTSTKGEAIMSNVMKQLSEAGLDVELEAIFAKFILSEDEGEAIREQLSGAIERAGAIKHREVMKEVGQLQQSKKIKPGIYKSFVNLNVKLKKAAKANGKSESKVKVVDETKETLGDAIDKVKAKGDAKKEKKVKKEKAKAAPVEVPEFLKDVAELAASKDLPVEELDYVEKLDLSEVTFKSVLEVWKRRRSNVARIHQFLLKPRTMAELEEASGEASWPVKSIQQHLRVFKKHLHKHGWGLKVDGEKGSETYQAVRICD